MTRRWTEAIAGGRAAWTALLAPLVISGCIGVNSAADRSIAAARLPRPAVILVHDFAVSPDEVRRSWDGSGKLVDDSDRTAAEKAVGHTFADQFAAALVDEIRKLGLPAERAGAPDLPAGDVVGIEGRFISLAGDPSAPGIVGFAGDRPDVIADVQVYAAGQHGDELSDEVEISISQGNAALPVALLPDPTITAGQVETTRASTPAQQAKLAAAARDAAGKVAGQLEPYFAEHGWIARAQG